MTLGANVSRYLKAPYHRVFFRDGELIGAQVLELPGCFSSGETPDEAWENLEDAMEIWIESELEAGQRIPEPLDSQAFSGRVTLRLPPSVHHRAALLAELEGVSLNRLLSAAIASYAPPASRRAVPSTGRRSRSSRATTPRETSS